MSNKAFAIVVTIIVLMTFLPILIVIFWEEKYVDEVTPTIETNNEQVSTNGSENEIVNETNNTNTNANTNTNENTKVNDPYIPTGFSYSEGSNETGYVIKDEYGNEYVWVPVESGKLESDIAENPECEENEETVTEFINSVSQYYGFYIARYETSVYESEKKIAATMKNKNPCVNIMYENARNAATNSAEGFGYVDCKTALVNSYAWNSTLAWLESVNKNYSTSLDYGNYSGEVLFTGVTQTDKINNICDMAGNVMEWTTEVYNKNTDSQDESKYRVIRGGSANLNKSANGHVICNELSYNSMIGFRMILYK